MRLSHHHQFCSERCRKVAKRRLRLTHDTTVEEEIFKIAMGQHEEVEEEKTNGAFVRRI
jgi:hypothetical protein